MTQILGNEQQGLCFEITSARPSQEEPKYVIYSIRVCYNSQNDDAKPAAIERRYTQFLNMYNALKKDQPQLMINIGFPKKRLFGNFDAALIAQRSAEFQALLNHVASESRLRSSSGTMIFLQEPELTLAKDCLKNKDFQSALVALEQTFILLNKVLTDRSPPVLLGLCRLVGCSTEVPGMPGAYKWGDLALHRFEGVCDSDLLELYIPLIHCCIKIWKVYGKDIDKLQDQLTNIKLKGISIDDKRELLEVVDSVEKKLYNT